jgi:hypothetical protein
MEYFHPMKNWFFLLVFASLLIAIYFLGKKNGSSETRTTIIENIASIKQIAELSTLEVKGTCTVKLSNANQDGDWWNKMKDYLMENTLQVTVPYTAKFGVDMSQPDFNVAIKDSTVNIHLPACKLLSLQLRLDELQTMNQTGILASTTIYDLTKAEKTLYQQVMQQLAANTALISQAQQYTGAVYTKIYSPAGYHVVCTFGNK